MIVEISKALGAVSRLVTGTICFLKWVVRKLTARFVSSSRSRCSRLPPSNRRICENYKRSRAQKLTSSILARLSPRFFHVLPTGSFSPLVSGKPRFIFATRSSFSMSRSLLSLCARIENTWLCNASDTFLLHLVEIIVQLKKKREI